MRRRSCLLNVQFVFTSLLALTSLLTSIVAAVKSFYFFLTRLADHIIWQKIIACKMLRSDKGMPRKEARAICGHG